MRRLKRSCFVAFGLTLIFILTPLQFFHELYCQVLKREVSTQSIYSQALAYAEVLVSFEDTLATFFPDADKIESTSHKLSDEQQVAINDEGDLNLHPVFDRTFDFYAARKNGEVVGYAVADAVSGKWGPIRYAVKLDVQGNVMDVIVLEYQEQRGRPVAKRRFLKQFFGKGIKNKIRLRKDIRGVTGATMSSRGMTDGVRKIVHVFNEFYIQKQN